MLDVLDGDGHDLVGDEGANAQVDEVVRDRTSKERASAENLMVSVADCCSVRGGKRKLSVVGAYVRAAPQIMMKNGETKLLARDVRRGCSAQKDTKPGAELVMIDDAVWICFKPSALMSDAIFFLYRVILEESS